MKLPVGEQQSPRTIRTISEEEDGDKKPAHKTLFNTSDLEEEDTSDAESILSQLDKFLPSDYISLYTVPHRDRFQE